MILTNFKPSKAIQKSKSGVSAGKGYLTLVNSTQNGKRIEIRKEIAEKLALSKFLSIVYTDDSALFFRTDTEGEGVFRIKKNGERFVVYSYELVAELSAFFKIDFSSGVCHTFTEGTFEKIEELAETALIITKKKLENVEV